MKFQFPDTENRRINSKANAYSGVGSVSYMMTGASGSALSQQQ